MLVLVSMLGLPGAASAGPLEAGSRVDASEPSFGPAFFLNLLFELVVGEDSAPSTDPGDGGGGESSHGGGGMDPNGGGGKSEVPPPPPEPKP